MSSRTVRCVSFDFDNTLLLSENCKHATMREVCSRYEQGLEILSTIPTDSRTAPPGKSVTRHTIFTDFAAALDERGLHSGDETVEALGARLCEEFSELVQKRLAQAEEVPGAAAMLAHLGAQRIPCCVNSATPVEPLEQLIDALGWREHFKQIFGAPGTKVENLWLAARSLNLLPEELVHVGDGDNDRKAAQEFGCIFIGVCDSADGPDGKWAGAPFTLVSDMHAACAKICELAGVPARG
jgi:phosphoglycolate phosphatase-like HAD superfamily hydrolase